MAIKIDIELLQQLGLDALPEAEKNFLLRHIYETLEMRVGMRLADQMTNEQLDEFERYFDAKDDAGAFKWLETNFPNYKDIVQQEFDKLKAEIARDAPQMLAASQQPPAAPMAPAPVAAAPAAVPATPVPAAVQQQATQAPAPMAQPVAAPQPQPATPVDPNWPTQQPPAGPGSAQM